MINDKVASDRLLPPAVGAKQLDEIKRTKASTHEVTLRLNKVVLLLKQKKMDEAKKELDDLARTDDAAQIRDERYAGIRAYIATQDGDKDKALDQLAKFIKQYESGQQTSSFCSKAKTYAQLYSVQLLLAKGDWDAAVKLVVQTFNDNARWCNNENYVVFMLTLLKRLTRVTPKANTGLVQVVEAVRKAIQPGDDRSAAILAYMADLTMSLGTAGYATANALYEQILSTVLLRFTNHCKIGQGQQGRRAGLHIHQMCDKRGRLGGAGEEIGRGGAGPGRRVQASVTG